MAAGRAKFDREAPGCPSGIFEEYYREQAICKSAEDLNELIECMKKPLPISFRVIQNSMHTKWMQAYLEKMKGCSVESRGEGAIEEVKFLRFGEGWVLNVSREDLRKDACLRELRELLVQYSETGLIIRQEVVSMIPANFLLESVEQCWDSGGAEGDSAEGPVLLDMCAAPGSKTSQLLEGLDVIAKRRGIAKSVGSVVANEINSTRAHMLIHHLKYQPCEALLVTLHNAALFPRLWREGPQAALDGREATLDGPQATLDGPQATLDGPQAALHGWEAMRYDGILCDVPCSGDGTLRKQPSIWRTWRSSQGMYLHGLQMRILKKALALCKVGGCVVYSTCSLNPIENEAVVGAILRTGGGSVVINPSVRALPNLVYRPGLTDWKVHINHSYYTSYSDCLARNPTASNPPVFASFFPPTEQSIQQSLRTGCFRYYPHDNDTGAFFVSVLRKLAPTPWEGPHHDKPANDKAVYGQPAVARRRADSGFSTATCNKQLDIEAQACANEEASEDDVEAENSIEVGETGHWGGGGNKRLVLVPQDDLQCVADEAEVEKVVCEFALDKFGFDHSLTKKLFYRRKAHRRNAGTVDRADNAEASVDRADNAEASVDRADNAEASEDRADKTEAKKIWFVNDCVAKLLRMTTINKPLRIVHAGATVFESRCRNSFRMPVGAWNTLARYAPPAALSNHSVPLSLPLTLLEPGMHEPETPGLAEFIARHEPQAHYVGVVLPSAGAVCAGAFTLPYYVGRKHVDVLLTPEMRRLVALVASTTPHHLCS